MKKIKKILLLGGTGAMGVYLAPECVKLGYKVYITTRKKRSSTEENIQFIQGDAKDIDFFNKITMEYQFDAIVDFMIYTTNEFKQKIDILLNAASHYIFLSTYRVFADCGLDSITESSPKLLNVSTDDIYLKTDEYALTKAKQENLLLNSSYKNWTIVRPSITYSTNRFQLGVFEAEHFLSRALRSEYIPLPLELLNNQTTMTWGGDVGKMIALLILNKNSFGEDFNVVTSESVSWKSVADIYGDIIALKIKVVELKKFTLLVSNPWQLK
jgi:nucleoside-diphosphate-sugar epimerase